mmetsp:Transcript_20866/g.65677  ORF Transcript_20866/g.65677 Transcript_20866/m.65677 type:complete len:432 (-) Transcript_20866:78-1373(-)|eukprot:CAMPEP_0197388982 /NCGR_PEP_ID=MMETSP1165-20131217/1357_1 /TAXON_ID=284809 /ORGANISM="Chrysocystis fragilis, Strain CCMP3189" /LENGTH=431 /DNA_ID=CAMNT_0042914337 /DNA_START=61 /DNA_END=1356 /DNA_ORIENTATION=-
MDRRWALRLGLVASWAATAVALSGVARNVNFGKLQGGYLFPEVNRRRRAFAEAQPELASKVISLGIGDTTQPIPEHILSGLVEGASKLGTREGYSGYGAEQGNSALRERIAQYVYKGKVSADEVFVSDGAKCDIARLQLMFGSGVTSAVQDPSYPVYVDTSVMMGQTGTVDDKGQFAGLVYMPCLPENDFFPDLENTPRADVYYFCSPNNPTGAVATRAQLEALVARARADGSIVVFDAAYAPFIRTPGVPKSIFDIDGAETCCIEVNSFSKYAGFTGVRLGWTVVPAALEYADGFKVRDDFNRVMTTAFNGASNVVQNGGLACLTDEGMAEIDTLIEYYLGNAEILRGLADDLDLKHYGGLDSPYVFLDLNGKNSWDVFSAVLEEAQVVTIPGAGFGPSGLPFLRLSAFAPRAACEEARDRISKLPHIFH